MEIFVNYRSAISTTFSPAFLPFSTFHPDGAGACSIYNVMQDNSSIFSASYHSYETRLWSKLGYGKQTLLSIRIASICAARATIRSLPPVLWGHENVQDAYPTGSRCQPVVRIQRSSVLRNADDLGNRMVKKISPIRSAKFKRNNRITMGHVHTVPYIAGIAL